MIYLVEDDDNIRELVVYTLAQSGLKAVGFALPHEFYEACAKEPPRLVLLDIMLPEEDGLSILRKLRADPATKKLPVMMLTAKGSEYDKVVGLDQGADDYLPKPFDTGELMARIRAMLRRNAVFTPDTVRFSDLIRSRTASLAVRIRQGVEFPCFLKRSSTSIPLIPGIIQSRMMPS